MKILFASSEVVPFAKTGGLADVSGILPVHLKSNGCDVRVITPFHGGSHDQASLKRLLIDNLSIRIGTTKYSGQIWEGMIRASVPVYLVKCDAFFNREYLYGLPGSDYPDNAERFIFFCHSVFELCKHLEFHPDIIHCNDWQTGLIPAYVKSLYRDNPFFTRTATLFTIHNIAYQGVFHKDKFHLTGLPAHCFSLQGIEYWGKMSLLKSGLMYADVLNTVSRTYSREILTPEYGYGMNDILVSKKNDLYSVLNGADYEEWNPAHDSYIVSPYGITSVGRKKECKKDLLRAYDLPPDMLDKPLIGCISRLVDQKGFDLIAQIMDELMRHDLGFVLLGTGDKKYQELFSAFGRAYRGKAGVRIAYDTALAHKIEAGCDMFLMPSRYEPCGLNQLYSMKYGTVPIVRATGGLDDTVRECDDALLDGCTGFKFREYSSTELLKTICRALDVYCDKTRWNHLMKNCMFADFSWTKSAHEYIELYKIAFRKKTGQEI